MPIEKQVGLLRVAVQEYREGVVGAEVVNPGEVAAAAEILEMVSAAAPSPELDRIRELVGAQAPVQQVAEAFGAWFEAYGVGVAPAVPPQRPSVTAGGRLFLRYCVSCHGEAGDGKGALAELVEGPSPADFTDESFMAGETPNEFFQVITYGLPGTAMPEWGPVLAAADRWNLVAYLWGLRESARLSAGAASGRGAACLDCHDGTTAVDLASPVGLLARSDTELAERMPVDRAHRFDELSDARSDLQSMQMVALARRLGMAADALGERSTDTAAETVDPRHVMIALSLISEEYRDAVRDGQIVSQIEYGESRLFQARIAADVDALIEQNRLSRPDRARALAASVGEAIYSKAAPEELASLAEELRSELAGDLEGADAADGEDGEKILARVDALLAKAQRELEQPGGAPADRLLEAYMIFESAERRIAARDKALAAELEQAFARTRSSLLAERDAGDDLAALRAGLLRAQAVLEKPAGAWAGFVASLFIILREGFEAILIISALAAYLTKGGHLLARRWLYAGALVGVAASILTAGAIELVLGELGLAQEVLEGATMLLAAIVLFSVSYWLISKVEAQHWQTYIRERLNHALGTGSMVAMAGVSFLAVFREGFETVLFYRALVIGSTALAPIFAGLAIGCLGLVALYVGITRFSMRVPIKPFFTGTGILLYVLSFRFLGAGIAELQGAGVLSLTPVSWWPEFRFLDMASNLETGLAQLALIVAALVAAAVIGLGPRVERA